jgi:hypothetical protein
MSPFDFYRKLIMEDEWPENDTEVTAGDSNLQFGSSVRAGAKAARNLGLLSEYSWAFDGNTARQWVLDHSPVILGTDWLSNMFSVDPNGFVDVSGGIAGGHAYLWYGTDLRELRPDGKRGVDYFLNSWGMWGIGGKGVFKMRSEDTDRLIAAQGEACTASEVKYEKGQ